MYRAEDVMGFAKTNDSDRASSVLLDGSIWGEHATYTGKVAKRFIGCN
jgi:hypothetical protein